MKTNCQLRIGAAKPTATVAETLTETDTETDNETDNETLRDASPSWVGVVHGRVSKAQSPQQAVQGRAGEKAESRRKAHCGCG